MMYSPIPQTMQKKTSNNLVQHSQPAPVSQWVSHLSWQTDNENHKIASSTLKSSKEFPKCSVCRTSKPNEARCAQTNLQHYADPMKWMSQHPPHAPGHTCLWPLPRCQSHYPPCDNQKNHLKRIYKMAARSNIAHMFQVKCICAGLNICVCFTNCNLNVSTLPESPHTLTVQLETAKLE